MDDVVQFLLEFTSGKDGFVIELFCCEVIFSLFTPLRRYAGVKLPLCIAAYFAYGFFAPVIPAREFQAIVTCVLIFAISIFLQYLCFDVSLKRVLFNSSAAYILQNLALNIKEILRLLIGWSGAVRLAFETLAVLAVFAAAYFLFARMSRQHAMHVRGMWVVIISFFTIFISNMLFAFINHEGLGNSIYVKLLFIICCVLSLLFQFGIFRHEELVGEKTVIEQLLLQEQKQHRMSQENIDIINIKCHDLKKQIGLLKRGMKGRSDMDDVFREVEEAVMFYDESIKTGNENLDLILTEKQLYCKKHEIRLEVMAEGEALDFMAPTDVYSLFGNAVDNAIESVINADVSKRVINISVRRKGDIVCASVTNWCDGSVRFDGSLPVTNKTDSVYHGYGTRSIKFVAERYRGNVVFDAENNIFSVNMIIPVPQTHMCA